MITLSLVKLMKFSRQRNLSTAIQFFNLRYQYPDMEIKLHKNKIQCWFTVSPTPLSKTYKNYMFFDGIKRPKVFLYGENVLKINDDNFPHFYDRNIENKEVELCLYYGKEWDRTKLISETIIPWTVEWLAHYEIWLVTGKWNGGGKHPRLENRKDKDKKAKGKI